MAVRIFNPASVGAIVGIIFLFTTLWRLQKRPEYISGFSQGSPEIETTKPIHTKVPKVDPVVETPRPSPHVVEIRPSLLPVVEVRPLLPPVVDEYIQSPPVVEEQVPQPPVTTRLSWTEIATKWGTDKVTTHHYNYMYEKYLEPMRDRPLKMLEIGLGCDMSYGPGASYHTWLEFFPHVDMYYIEYDAACVEKWATSVVDVTVFTGDQADTAFLHKFISESGGNFDIIVDDGGHSMKQQITSLNTLFDIVVPGGIYFCEDLATSYEGHYGAVPGARTMMQMVGELLHDLNSKLRSAPAAINAVGDQMRSIECGEEICAFFKKNVEKTDLRQ